MYTGFWQRTEAYEGIAGWTDSLIDYAKMAYSAVEGAHAACRLARSHL